MDLQTFLIAQSGILICGLVVLFCYRRRSKKKGDAFSNISALHFRMKILDNYQKCLTGMTTQSTVFSKIDVIDKKLINMTNTFDTNNRDKLIEELNEMRGSVVDIARNIYNANDGLTDSKRTLLEYIINSKSD